VRRFLRWLVGVQAEGELYDQQHALRQRVEVLEDDAEHWERRFKKLQGQVTRAWREQPLEEEESDEDEFERLLEEKRRSHA